MNSEFLLIQKLGQNTPLTTKFKAKFSLVGYFSPAPKAAAGIAAIVIPEK